MNGESRRGGQDQLPFLSQPNQLEALHHQPHRLEEPPNPRPRSRSLWSLCLFFLFVILSFLALSSVPLGGLQVASLAAAPLSSASEHVDAGPAAVEDQSQDEEHHEPPPQQLGENGKDGSHGQDGQQDNEQMPSVPRLRDLSEYVLSPSWDSNAAPTTRLYNWTILDARLNPDGVYRPMILINNQFPGPLVECNEGDTIIVNVENKGVNATSIHFHGLYQNGTNNMDGAVGITQCPISPNSTFTYKFDVRGQSGTYWYHAHHSAQASDGLLGPVVIHSKDERTLQKLEYATDRIVMLQDHYHNLTSELLMGYLRPDMENREPIPDNALINGRGVRICTEFGDWECDASQASTPVFDLAAGQRHRLRIINVGAFAEFQLQFDEHSFYVTEVDGTDVFPEPYHRVTLLPSQRYSILIETNVTTANAFWMRARMVTHCFALPRYPRLLPEVRAIIQYTSPESDSKSASSSSTNSRQMQAPTSQEWPDAIEVKCRDMNVTRLHPVIPMPAPPADAFITLRASIRIGDWALARGFFNDSTWHHNVTHPSLHRFLDAGPELTTLNNTPIANNDLAFEHSRELVLQTEGIRVIDLAINNFNEGAHPFHLHGHKFFVLASAPTGYPPAPEEWPAYLLARNATANPLRRDTITVEGFGWAVIRVVLDNPGIWAFHCHNLWHAEAGMLMQMVVRSEVVRTWSVGVPEREMCGLPGVERGKRPDDSIWFGHFE